MSMDELEARALILKELVELEQRLGTLVVDMERLGRQLAYLKIILRQELEEEE